MSYFTPTQRFDATGRARRTSTGSPLSRPLAPAQPSTLRAPAAPSRPKLTFQAWLEKAGRVYRAADRDELLRRYSAFRLGRLYMTRAEEQGAVIETTATVIE